MSLFFQSGVSKVPSTKEPDVTSATQLTTESQAPIVNGLAIEHQAALSSKVESERPINTPYPGMIASNQLVAHNPHVNIVNNAEKSQVMQLTLQHNAQYSFPKHAFQPNEPVLNVTSNQSVAERPLMSPPGSHILTNDVPKKDRTQKKNRGDRDKEKELKDKKNQIWQEREREWKLLQQQRQQENRKQQQQNQDSYAVRKDVRTKPSKTPDWRKTSSQNDSSNSSVGGQHGKTVVTSSNNDNTIQIQLSNYISSSQSSGADQQLQHASVMSVPQAERVVEHSQTTASLQLQTVAATTSITTVENPVPFWTPDTSHVSVNPLPGTPSTTASSGGHPQVWMQQHEQQQHSVQLQRQISEPPIQQHEVRQDQVQSGQQEQAGLSHPTLPSNVAQAPASTANPPILSENDPHRLMSRDAIAHQSAAQHLVVTRPEMSVTPSKQSDTSLEQTPRQKQQDALRKQQHIQHLQKQQQLQQQDVLQREQRKQLAQAQQQQQEYIQRQLKHNRLPPQPTYPTPQPPRQANQFTANSKELPEIDTEEEHQERLQYLYRQRQLQKQMQARQYMMQQQTPAPPPMWVNNAQMMPGLPQGIPSDPIQQRLLLEQQQRASQRLDLQRVSMDTHPHHISSPFNQPSIPTPLVEPTPKFNFHQPAKNGQNDSELLTSTQVAHSQVSISTFTTQAGATSHTTTASIFSEIASAKIDSRKSVRKDRRNSTIDLSSHSGHFGTVFPSAVESESQRDDTSVNNNKNELLTVGQETCVTVEEGNARRVDTTVPNFVTENDKRREHEEQSTGDQLNAKSSVLPYSTANPGLQNIPANPQLVLPPPQLSLSPQQQHMLLQAQQQQLLWQQAHSQLQHQYQVLYQQLQQLQIQLQQTQDPALHQRVLRQQQQLRFLQTQILQHWQQGQIVVQQIHLQAFGLNAMLSQMDPTQQKHMQLYQQELVRQQQQWAQQFGGALGLTDIFGRIPGMPQENRSQITEVGF